MEPPTSVVKREVALLLFPMAKVAQQQQPQQQSWNQYAQQFQDQMKQYGGQYGAPVAAGGLAGVGAYGLGQALGFSPGASAVGAAIAAPAVGYLTHRFQEGHFNPLLQEGGMSWENLGKALWGSNQPSKS